MRYLVILLVLLASVLTASSAKAQECDGTCVPDEDMDAIVQILRERKCLNDEKPEFKLDPVTIVIDQEGRVYGSGAQPKPYTVTMSWCNLEARAEGKVQLLVAKREPPVWGFRFRPKFQSGFLFVDALKNKDALSAVDVGLLLEPVYYRQFNLNVAVGFRSLGAGLGFDITKNFGAYAGYAVSYDSWLSNPYAGLSFAFW